MPVAGMAEQRSLLVARIARLIEGKTPASPAPKFAFRGAAIVMLSAMVAAAPGVQDGVPAPPRPPLMPSPRLAGGPMNRERLPEDTGVVDALIDRLKDSDAGVRRAAARSLGNLHSRRAVPALIAVLDDRDREVRAAAAGALGSIEDSRAVGPLQLLIKDPSADVRSQAVDALREIKDPSATSAITGALKDDHPNVRRAALEALRELRVPVSENVLLDALDDPSADVRSGAVQLASERPFPTLVAVLKKLLDDPNGDVRVEAVYALGELRADGALTDIERLLHTDPDVPVRVAAAAFSELHDLHKAPEALVRAATGSDVKLRRIAAHALTEIADPATITVFAGLLTSDDRELRLAAVHALGQIGAPKSVADLVRMLKDPDAEVRRAAAEVLGDMKLDDRQGSSTGEASREPGALVGARVRIAAGVVPSAESALRVNAARSREPAEAVGPRIATGGRPPE